MSDEPARDSLINEEVWDGVTDAMLSEWDLASAFTFVL